MTSRKIRFKLRNALLSRTVSKETYYMGKRDLLCAEKRAAREKRAAQETSYVRKSAQHASSSSLYH